MEQDMRVSKHVTVKKADDSETYKVVLAFASMVNTQRVRAKSVTLETDDVKVFEQYPLNELVSLKISKPQKRLA